MYRDQMSEHANDRKAGAYAQARGDSTLAPSMHTQSYAIWSYQMGLSHKMPAAKDVRRPGRDLKQ